MKQSEYKRTGSLTKCFDITVDGKVFGPYLFCNKPKISYLEHARGIEIKTLFIREGWKEFSPPRAPKQRDTTPLLDLLDFTPIPKQQQGEGF